MALARSAETLSGGEAQRIRLASQIGAGLVGVMYVLDEPSVGLHQRDNARLLGTLRQLRDLGNTVIVVEHDEEAILSADHVLDIGPGAGVHGGRVVAQGRPGDIIKEPKSITAAIRLAPRKSLPLRRTRNDPKTIIRCVRTPEVHRRLDSIGLLTCALAYPGQTDAINDSYMPRRRHYGSIYTARHRRPGNTRRSGHDQSPITYAPGIRHRHRPPRRCANCSRLPEARARGYNPGRFSFNVRGGRCEACQGDGLIKVEMHFLPDIYVSCDVCKGLRYNRETLDIRYKGKTVHEVLSMTVEDAAVFFDAIPAIKRKLDTRLEVGLSYLTLGQSATTLSGGEAQRIKLSRELSKRDTGRTLYILDEPTTGLHFHDIKQLLAVLHRLRDHGNTVVVIEHNLDVIKTADWLIDLGPEGGDGGDLLRPARRRRSRTI